MLFGAHGLVGVDNDSDIREYKIMISICMYSFFFLQLFLALLSNTLQSRGRIFNSLT